MADNSNNSKSAQRRRATDRNSVDYIYQAATIIAALLLVLSAAV